MNGLNPDQVFAVYSGLTDEATVHVGRENLHLPGVEPYDDRPNQQLAHAKFASREEAPAFMEQFFGKEVADREHRRAMRNRASYRRKSDDHQICLGSHGRPPKATSGLLNIETAIRRASLAPS
jgi:hypothetical protein